MSSSSKSSSTSKKINSPILSKNSKSSGISSDKKSSSPKSSSPKSSSPKSSSPKSSSPKSSSPKSSSKKSSSPNSARSYYSSRLSSNGSELGTDDQIIPLGNHFKNSVFYTPIVAQFNATQSVMIVPPGLREYVIVSTIIDGNSFFHSLLKTCYPEYNVADESLRTEMAQQFRLQAVYLLSQPNLNYSDDKSVKDLYLGLDPRTSTEKHLPINCYYYTFYKGILPRIFGNIDNNIKGFQYLVDSLETGNELPSIFYFFFTEICYFNLNIFRHEGLQETNTEGFELELTTSYISTPPRELILENSKKGLLTEWERSTICFIEVDLDEEQKAYQPIGYRTYDSGDLVSFNFKSTGETFK
jgi:hypothetical protein